MRPTLWELDSQTEKGGNLFISVYPILYFSFGNLTTNMAIPDMLSLLKKSSMDCKISSRAEATKISQFLSISLFFVVQGQVETKKSKHVLLKWNIWARDKSQSLIKTYKLIRLDKFKLSKLVRSKMVYR